MSTSTSCYDLMFDINQGLHFLVGKLRMLKGPCTTYVSLPMYVYQPSSDWYDTPLGCLPAPGPKGGGSATPSSISWPLLCP